MSAPNAQRTVIELTVNNHPGVMSHVCGLFSRRAYNVEAILCLPEPDPSTSRIWLLVDAGQVLDQILAQTRKLDDVQKAEPRSVDQASLGRIAQFFGHAPA
jgi:acetolactate synthase-1/3 small subunit